MTPHDSRRLKEVINSKSRPIFFLLILFYPRYLRAVDHDRYNQQRQQYQETEKLEQRVPSLYERLHCLLVEFVESMVRVTYSENTIVLRITTEANTTKVMPNLIESIEIVAVLPRTLLMLLQVL